MSYELDWLDERRRIVAVRLYDPLSSEELAALRDEFLPLIALSAPLYILADIREFNALQGAAALVNALDGEALPNMGEDAMRQSRIAVLGGGALVKMVLSLAHGALNEDNLIRTFDHEDEAYAWLGEQAGDSAHRAARH